MAKEKMWKMPRALKRRWVKALRSGEYKQTEGELRDDVGYCCLGVLAKIQGCSEAKLQKTDNLKRQVSSAIYKTDLSRYAKGMPDEVQDKLTNMNDGANVPKRGFRAIATWIEKYL